MLGGESEAFELPAAGRLGSEMSNWRFAAMRNAASRRAPEIYL